MLDQTITFKEPCSAGVTHSTAPLRINVQRPYIVYGHDEEIVRYAMTNKATFGKEFCRICILLPPNKVHRVGPYRGPHVTDTGVT